MSDDNAWPKLHNAMWPGLVGKHLLDKCPDACVVACGLFCGNAALEIANHVSGLS